MAPGPGGTHSAQAQASAPNHTSAVVIGAGPVGLFQVFELGLLDIRAHVIDALPHLGGQPVQLYPDKPIYDIPGIPVCTGQGLADALQRQCAPFQPNFHLGQLVTRLERNSEGGFLLESSAGTQWITPTVFIAAGVGAFEPKRIRLDGIDAFEGTQLHYHFSQLGAVVGEHVLVMGDDDHALSSALALAEQSSDKPASVTLMHRRDSFRASDELVARFRERCAQGVLRFVVGQLSGYTSAADRLHEVLLTTTDGSVTPYPTTLLLSLQGLSPRLGAIADWGLDMERKQLAVDTERFSTSVAGIFAVGDINTYPGKRKLLLCGFHECTLAAYAAAALVYPDRPVQLQYTTTSTHLHELLGVRT